MVLVAAPACVRAYEADASKVDWDLRLFANLTKLDSQGDDGGHRERNVERTHVTRRAC